jgi:hypothetical protein
MILSKLNFFISLKNAFNSAFSSLGSPLYVNGKCSNVALFLVILLSRNISCIYCLDISKFGNLFFNNKNNIFI